MSTQKDIKNVKKDNKTGHRAIYSFHSQNYTNTVKCEIATKESAGRLTTPHTLIMAHCTIICDRVTLTSLIRAIIITIRVIIGVATLTPQPVLEVVKMSQSNRDRQMTPGRMSRMKHPLHTNQLR